MKLEQAKKTRNGKEGWKETIKMFAEKANLPYPEARAYFFMFCECFHERIRQKGRLNLPYVGTFRTTEMKERKCGRGIILPTYVLRFKACQLMKKSLHEAYKERKFER